MLDTSKANKISFDWDDEDEVDPSYVRRLDVDETDDVWVSLDTEYYSGSYQVTSSDPNVVTAERDEDDDCITLKGISAGTATVTVKVNGAERSFKVQVYGDDEDE